MKKLVLLLAVAFSVSMFSCGGNGEAAEEPVVAEEVTEETVEVPDSVAEAPADSVAEAPADSVAEAPAAE